VDARSQRASSASATEELIAPVRIAVVGCGAIADYLHFPAIALADGVTATVAVDADQSRAEAAALKFGAAVATTDLSRIAEHADVAVIAVPPHLKVAVGTAALEAGVHVLCEKPLANTVADCERLIAASRNADRLLGAMHQFRFWPSRKWIRDQLVSGAMSMPLRVDVSQGAPYSWQSVTGYTVRRELVSGGVLINAGTHPLDTLISWFGDPDIIGYWDDSIGGLESNARMHLSFPGGVEAHFRQSRTCRLANEIRLIYSDRQFVVNNSDPFRVWERRNAAPDRATVVGDSPHGFLAPAAAVYDNFAAAISGKEPLAVDGGEATRVIQLVENCYARKACRPLPTSAPLPGLTW
jgi:predicted dehydrogenase